MKGEDRHKVIRSLIGRGVCNIEKAEAMDSLADDVFGFLWNRIESSLQSEELGNRDFFAALKGNVHARPANLLQLLTYVSTRLA